MLSRAARQLRPVGSYSDVARLSPFVFAATAPTDGVPNQFTFTDQTGVALSTVITGTGVTITGIDTTVPFTATGGTIDVNSDGNFQTSRDVVNNDVIRPRHTSAATNSTQTSTVVTGGGVSDAFTTTTLAATSNGLGLIMHMTFTDLMSARTINERSSVSIVTKFWDGSTEVWTASTPTNVYYRLDSINGDQITDWTSVTPGSSATIALSSSQTSIINDCADYEVKQLTVMADRGLSTQYQDTFVFKVRNLSGQT